jgi:hypothetical protein
MTRISGIFIQQSRMVITSTRLSANTAASAGGGIHAASAFITLTAATIIDNKVVTSFGGGLTIFGWASIVNSTISGNSAVNGGAIRLGIGDHIITNTTIASNTAVTGGGLFDDPLYFGNTKLNNTIIAGNSPTNCANDGQIFSQGHNLDSGSSCGFTATGDLTNTNPLLGPLQDNGAPTWSHSLTTGSPAVNTANNNTCPNTDQRGAPRPLDGDMDGLPLCDIGAYELSQYQIYLPAVVN